MDVDRELATGVMAGDEAAFRALYRRHTPRLWPLLRRMLGGPGIRPEVEDAVQETWIRAVEGLPSFRWQAAFSTWLTGIALNCAREALRKRSRRGETGTDLLLEQSSAPPPDPGRRLDLENAIAALPDGYRTVLVLHDIEGFTHVEIAERLGIAEGTSKSQLHHARRAVRAHLEPGDRQETDAIR
jgi:RNA polymerase sigma factor (sigma-70 family)